MYRMSKEIKVLVKNFLVVIFRVGAFALLAACEAGEVGAVADAAADNAQTPTTAMAQVPATVGVTPQDGNSAAPMPASTVCPLGQQPNGNIGGPSICCSGAYQVCDDFEGDTTGGSPNAKFWQVELLNKSYGNQPNDALDANAIDHNAIIEISETMAARG